MPDERRLLTKRLRAVLLPELEARGFRMAPLEPNEARGEIGRSFPLGRLRRAGTAGLEVVEVQLDKHGRAAFRINFGVAPPGGVRHPHGHVDQDDVWVHYLPQWYALYDIGFLGRRWFSTSRCRLTSAGEAELDRLVHRVASYIPQIEAVFRGEAPGRHVRTVAAW